MYSVVSVPPGKSVSAYSMAAKERRQDLERQALRALQQGIGGSEQAEGGETTASGTQSTRSYHALAPVVRVALEQDVAGEVRSFLESEPNSLLLFRYARSTGRSARGSPRLYAGPFPAISPGPGRDCAGMRSTKRLPTLCNTA